MANYYFQVLTAHQAIFDGTFKLTTSACTTGTYANGMLVEPDYTVSPPVLVLSGASGSPIGQLNERRALIYFPQDEFLIGADQGGKYTNIVTGYYEALCGPDLFSAGAVPTVGAKLYTAASGLIGVSGTTAIGICIRTETVQRSTGAFNAARCRFNLTQII